MGFFLFVPLLCASLSGDADEGIAQARAHVQNLDYELAREELLELLGRDDLTSEQTRDAHMLAGTIARILNRDTESRMHYSAALDEDAAATLPEGQPPKITTFFSLVKKEHRAAQAPDPAPVPTVVTEPAAEQGVSHGLYLGAMGGTGLAAILGVGLSVVGVVPLVQYTLAKQALDEKLADKDATGIGTLYQQQDQAASSFETWGLPLVVGGAALALVCAAASIGTGALWGVALVGATE